jgi:GT2 family glycosyltransferase
VTGEMLSRVGAVAIGKNEGERLQICLRSLEHRVERIVYVDSGSTDGSVEYARSVGAEVVELDQSIPFTAARSRNAGVARLREVAPEVRLVQLIDGDCELVDGWLQAAARFLNENPTYAAAAGHLRERFPERSVYNYLCDVEWATPVGDADACGGIAMMRVDAFTEVDGFRPDLIAGEEPELCFRLRERGWKIRRLDAEMARHDVAMTRFSQWWKRMRRGGHAYAEAAYLHGDSPDAMGVAESRRIVAWGLVLPSIAVAGIPFTGGLSIGLLLAYPLNVARIARRLRAEGQSRPWTLAFFLMLGKLPEALGWLRFQWGRLTGDRSAIIEHKGS